MSIENRVAVITGATGELGSVLAHLLASHRANLALLDRNPDRLESLKASLELPDERLFTRSIDLIDPASVQSAAQAVIAQFGKVDILLHLVGGWIGGKTLVETPPSDLEWMLNQHIWTTFYVTQAFVPHLVNNGWGRIVTISSPAAEKPGARGGVYAAAKAGQDTLILALSRELKGTGVTANLLQVNTIDVKREKTSEPGPKNSSWSTPEEIAGAILYLLSDEDGTVNGAKIPLFGG